MEAAGGSGVRVSKALRWAVFIRDGGCVLAKLEPGHECRDIWSQRHAANDFDRLTLEHVKSDLRMGVRAENDEAHLVALCGYANNRPPSKTQRALMREYLAGVAA
jgi:hypothetical protein